MINSSEVNIKAVSMLSIAIGIFVKPILQKHKMSTAMYRVFSKGKFCIKYHIKITLTKAVTKTVIQCLFYDYFIYE